MRSSKLVYFLAFLSAKERKRFADYLKSPYFNKNQECLELFLLLESTLLKYKNRDLSDEQAFKTLFSKAKFDQNAFRKLKTGLLDLLYSFLAQQRFDQTRGMASRFLMQELVDRGEQKYFPQLHKKAIKDLDPANGLGPADFETLFQLEQEMSRYILKMPNRKAENNLEQVLEHLENGYRVRKLKFACITLNQGKVLAKRPEIEGLESLLNEVQHSASWKVPLIQCYYHLYQTLAEPENVTHFSALQAALDQFGDKMHAGELHDLYVGAMNYCVGKINGGEEAFQPRLLSLYKMMLRDGILLNKGKLFPLHFKNMALLGAKVGEFEWVENLINTYGNKLTGQKAAGLVEFCHGVWFYFRGEIAEAIRRLNQVLDDYEDVYYGIDARSYLLRCYYESGDVDAMESLCNSFRVFLHRNNEISQGHKDNYQTFIRLYRRLFQLPPMDFAKINRLKAEILDSRRISGRNWLLQKLDQLINAIPSHKRT